MSARVTTISLAVTGRSLTENARNLVLDGQWREAVQRLQNALEGFTLDHAVAVLKGEARLSGSTRDSIILEEDPEPEDYLKELAFQYGGLARIEGALYMPRSAVTDFGERDMHLAISRDGLVEVVTENMLDIDRIDVSQLLQRARHYASNRSDQILLCEVPSMRDPGTIRAMPVIFELAGDVPMWVMPEKSPQAAVFARLSELEYTGHLRLYGSDDLATDRDPGRMAVTAKYNLWHSVSKRRISRDVLDENLNAKSDRSLETFSQRREAIHEQNSRRGYGLRNFDFGGDVGIREIPEGPLFRWALWRTSARGLAPEWEPICPQGVKQYGDDPVHSDWVVAAGLEECDLSAGPLHDRQMDLLQEIQAELLGFKSAVLVAGRPAATGMVVHARPDTPCDRDTIAVIPHAGPEYLEVARSAAAVISEKGGAMSHLAVVGLEEGFLIVRSPNARKAFPEGATVTVDPSKGEVRIEAFTEDEEKTSAPRF